MIVVMRIGHRPQRDMRVTTHVGLTARALGASGMYIASDDKGIVESIRDVALRFGGDFFVEDKVKWNSCIKQWKREGGVVVHLTMFGVNLPDVEAEIKTKEKIMVIVGAEKVPGEIYQLADYNVAVTNQPHSEIAGLAVFLDHVSPNALHREFPNAKVRVYPNPCGKTVEEL